MSGRGTGRSPRAGRTETPSWSERVGTASSRTRPSGLQGTTARPGSDRGAARGVFRPGRNGPPRIPGSDRGAARDVGGPAPGCGRAGARARVDPDGRRAGRTAWGAVRTRLGGTPGPGCEPTRPGRWGAVRTRLGGTSGTRMRSTVDAPGTGLGAVCRGFAGARGPSTRAGGTPPGVPPAPGERTCRGLAAGPRSSDAQAGRGAAPSAPAVTPSDG